MRDRWWIAILIAVLVLAVISPIASSFPDGLEKVAEDHQFTDKASGPPLRVIPDYTFPGIENEAVAKIFAGLMGTSVLFGLGLVIARTLKAKNEA